MLWAAELSTRGREPPPSSHTSLLSFVVSWGHLFPPIKHWALGMQETWKKAACPYSPHLVSDSSSSSTKQIRLLRLNISQAQAFTWSACSGWTAAVSAKRIHYWVYTNILDRKLVFTFLVPTCYYSTVNWLEVRERKKVEQLLRLRIYSLVNIFTHVFLWLQKSNFLELLSVGYKWVYVGTYCPGVFTFMQARFTEAEKQAGKNPWHPYNEIDILKWL